MKAIEPIKRHKAIVSFSKDHHFGLLLVWKIRQGFNNSVDPVRISNYVLHSFKEDLQNHFKEEEELLFSQLADDDVLGKKAVADHRSIYDLVAAIEVNKAEPTLLQRFADELEAHIRFEERELFNHLQVTFSAEEFAAIEKRMPLSSDAVDANWTDKFWEIKG